MHQEFPGKHLTAGRLLLIRCKIAPRGSLQEPEVFFPEELAMAAFLLLVVYTLGICQLFSNPAEHRMGFYKMNNDSRHLLQKHFFVRIVDMLLLDKLDKAVGCMLSKLRSCSNHRRFQKSTSSLLYFCNRCPYSNTMGLLKSILLEAMCK